MAGKRRNNPGKDKRVREIMERIIRVEQENPTTKTFYLDTEKDARPGQFCMIWLPGIGEKPFSITSTRPLGFAVKKVGPFTSKLLELKEGDRIGVRGPYGNWFEEKNNSLIIGGGCGIAPLALLAEKIKPIAIIGAKTKNELMFEKRIEKNAEKLITMTDDGSAGEKGFVTQALEKVLEQEKIERIYACGPEVMMVKCLEMAKKKGIEIQLSLERYMKCGIGICGSCAIGTKRVCTDGPVFTGKELEGTEFGKRKLDKSGEEVELE